MGVAISVSDVSKRFRLRSGGAGSLKELLTNRTTAQTNEFWALRDVSFDIEEGTMFALVGHNGSGKSTLLRCVAGIYRPTSGSISVNGRISALLELGSGFHPDLTGRENVYLNASILGMGRKEVDARLEQIVDFAGIGQFIDSPVRIYSSGMYVRLGFSVAVHIDPKVLIIDEVIAVGDEAFQRKCFEHLYQLRRSGSTIVVVSHSLGLIETMCDHAAWLDHGELKSLGAAPTVVHDYLQSVNAAEEEEVALRQAQLDPSAVVHGGSGEVRVSTLEVLDESGAVVPSATCGRPMTLRFNIDVNTPVDNAVIGFSINHDNGAHVADVSTWLDGVDLGGASSASFVDWTLDPCALAPGYYNLTVAVRDVHNQHFYDRVDHGFRLVVRQGERPVVAGVVDLVGRWSDGFRPRV